MPDQKPSPSRPDLPNFATEPKKADTKKPEQSPGIRKENDLAAGTPKLGQESNIDRSANPSPGDGPLITDPPIPDDEIVERAKREAAGENPKTDLRADTRPAAKTRAEAEARDLHPSRPDPSDLINRIDQYLQFHARKGEHVANDLLAEARDHLAGTGPQAGASAQTASEKSQGDTEARLEATRAKGK